MISPDLQELRDLRRRIRELLAAWRRTLKEDRAQMRRSKGCLTGVYYHGIADALSLCIKQLRSDMFPPRGAPAQHGAPSLSRRRRP